MLNRSSYKLLYLGLQTLISFHYVSSFYRVKPSQITSWRSIICENYHLQLSLASKITSRLFKWALLALRPDFAETVYLGLIFIFIIMSLFNIKWSILTCLITETKNYLLFPRWLVSNRNTLYNATSLWRIAFGINYLKSLNIW